MEMSRFKPMAFVLLLLLPSPVALAASGTRIQHWQEGEILSRKTITPGHHHSRTCYVYRIKSGGVQYVARFDQPLSLAPYAPLKLAVGRRHLFVQDADGSELKASILRKSEAPMRR
jgi:hypothetical protein